MQWKPCHPSLCLGPDASSPRMAELPPSRCKAQLVWEAMFVSCHLEREQSDKGDSLETSFSVFILTMRVEHKASDTFDKTYYFQVLLNICSRVKSTIWIQHQTKQQSALFAGSFPPLLISKFSCSLGVYSWYFYHGLTSSEEFITFKFVLHYAAPHCNGVAYFRNGETSKNWSFG